MIGMKRKHEESDQENKFSMMVNEVKVMSQVEWMPIQEA